MKRPLFYLLFSLTVTLMLPFVSFAQIGPPPDPIDTVPTEIPFDGGLSILLAAGVGYGLKKIRDNRKQKEERSQ